MKAGIAGSGIMGQLLAFSLINAGWDVTIFDEGLKSNCSMAAAGLLTPVAEMEKNDVVIFQLGIEALKQHWPVILSVFKNKIYFRQQGSLVLSHPNDHIELIRFIQMISHKMGNHAFYKQLNRDEIGQLEPSISKFSHAYYFPLEGQIDNQKLLMALRRYLILKKVTWIQNSIVSRVCPKQIILKDKTYSFDFVFDCRGLGAKNIFKDLRSVRGELIWLKAQDVSIHRPIRFLHPRYSLYIVPRPNNIFIIGASEIESEDNSSISVQTTLELLTAAYSVNSSFSEARIIKTVTHCRPTLENHLPKIKYSDGFIAVNGLYRHGFLIAPTLAHEIMHWIQHREFSRYQQLWEKYT